MQSHLSPSSLQKNCPRDLILDKELQGRLELEHWPTWHLSPQKLAVHRHVDMMAGSTEAAFGKETLWKIRLVMKMEKAEKLAEPENDGNMVCLPYLWTIQ